MVMTPSEEGRQTIMTYDQIEFDAEIETEDGWAPRPGSAPFDLCPLFTRKDAA